MSGFVDLRGIYFEAGAAASMIFALILGHGYLAGSGITVEYELYSNVTGETQVYWSIGEPLSEAKQSVRKIIADTRNDVRVNIAEKSPIKLIRIDPFKTPGIFRIQNIRVDLMSTLLPLGSWGRWVLKTENAAAINQVEKRADEQWKATGNDPYFLFQIPQASAKKVFLLNLLSGFAVVTFVVLLTRMTGVVSKGTKDPREYTTLSMALAGIYGVFFIIALLSSQFVRIEGYSRWVVYAVLMVWIVSYVLSSRGLASSAFINAMAGLSAMVIVIVLDVLFHFGIISKPVFSLYDSPLYHWQLGKPMSHNFVHSSLRYYDDFKAIENLIVPDSYFLSDVATSYYVSAALPLYAVNVLPHHRKSMIPIKKKVLRDLCDENKEPSLEVIELHLRQKAGLHKRKGLPPMRYLFLNTDKKNRHVASRCLARRHELIRATLDPILTPVHRGEFIDVYEFRTP